MSEVINQCGPSQSLIESNEPIIIGLAGYAGVGKTVIANVLANFPWENRLASVMPIAAPIKWFLETMGLEKGDPGYRDAAQSMSVIRDTVGADAYVRVCGDRIGNSSLHRVVIIDDIRFQNEIDYLRNRFPKSLFFRVTRRNPDPLGGMGYSNMRHISEVQVPKLDVDFTIDNRGTVHQAASAVWAYAMSLQDNPDHRAYLAGPIFGGDHKENEEKVLKVAKILVDEGKKVYCPQLEESMWGDRVSQFGGEEYKKRLNHSMSFLENWATVMVRMGGNSWGADLEEKKAEEIGVPVIPEEAVTRSLGKGFWGKVWVGNVTPPGH